jgi:1,4-alpha-glucan branching enzyme
MAITKTYPKSKSDICKITFELAGEAVPENTQVWLVGDFNGWDTTATPMRYKKKTGTHAVTLELPIGASYEFRYYLGDGVWENDWEADRYAPSPFGGCENSVVEL